MVAADRRAPLRHPEPVLAWALAPAAPHAAAPTACDVLLLYRWMTRRRDLLHILDAAQRSRSAPARNDITSAEVRR